jgi:NAD(P)-dependent dehydrogenase (short-subunit alcohol dehydrogenase family)
MVEPDKRRVALIAGASRGIGRQIAIRLAGRGLNLVLAARTLEPAESNLPGSLAELEREIRASGADCIAVKCDLSRRRDVENLCAAAMEKFGRVDILINNARHLDSHHWDTFLELDIDTWERVLDANLLAPIITSRLCLPGMIANRSGIIICTTSSYAERNFGLPGQGGTAATYPTSKAALNRFVLALALETQQYSIPVIALDPGATMTEVNAQHAAAHGFDTGRFHSMDIPAAAAEYLCCSCPDPMQYNGQVVVAAELVEQLKLLPRADSST